MLINTQSIDNKLSAVRLHIKRVRNTCYGLRRVGHPSKELMQISAEYGLEVHDEKTKVLWNGQGDNPFEKRIKIQNKSFEVLQSDKSTDYLGRRFSFTATHDVEIRNRVNKAWAKFNAYKSELTDKYYPLEQRMKILKAVVQPTLLYGCCSWAMTRSRERFLETTQRKMIRSII